MINFKFFACEPRVYYPLRNPYYIDTQISNTQGTTEIVRVMEIPGEVDYKETMAIGEWNFLRSVPSEARTRSSFAI